MCTLVTSGQVASNTCRPRRCASLLHGGRDPVRREDHRGTVRHLVQFLDEHRAERAEPLHHVAVVHHLVAHMDRRAEQLDGALDDLDGPIDTGTEATGIGEQDAHHR